MPTGMKQRSSRTPWRPTPGFRLVYYLLVAIASGVMIAILSLGSLAD